jgi:hypothetical protein
MAKYNDDADNRGNRIEHAASVPDAVVSEVEVDDHLELVDAPEPLPENLTIRISKALHRKLRDNAREEGVTIDEMISELLAEGVVLRAFEIVERKHTMRGGNQQQHRNLQNSNVNGNVSGNVAPHGNTQQGSHQHRNQFQQGGNRQAQKKLQRQARQHANAMDLLQDKAAFLEYVRNQEKKRR